MGPMTVTESYFSSIFDLAGTGDRGGAAYQPGAACRDTGQPAVAAAACSSGSAVQPRASCTGAASVLGACHEVGPAVPGRGCLRVTRRARRRRRH